MRRVAIPTLIAFVLGFTLAALLVGGGRGRVVAEAAPPSGEGSDEERELLPLIADAFELAGQQRVGESLAKLYDRAWDKTPDAERQLREMVQTLARGGQACTGTELVAVRRVSPRLTEVVTLSWFADGPVLFRGRFYQRDGKWWLHNFRVSADTNEFIETVPAAYLWSE